MATNYQLVLKSGAEAGKIFPIEATQITIGREQGTDIAINDPEISRRHAHIFLQGVNYVIEDLGSTNGTFVNGQRLVGPYILRSGELITLGENTHLLFEAVIGDPDATVAGSKPVGPQSYQNAPDPQAQSYTPAYQAPDVQRASGGYAGQVPSQPMEDATPRRKKLSPLVIVLIILVVLLLCSCIGFFIFDALNLYCEIPGIMNLLIPGACPP